MAFSRQPHPFHEGWKKPMGKCVAFDRKDKKGAANKAAPFA